MKIAIAGYGIEGRASYSYWNLPEHELTIVDEHEVVDDLPSGVATILGEGAFSKLNGFDMVIRTAGLTPRKIVTDGKIWSATNEFFAKSPAPIIGITGTKGKGTTASLIASILRAAGKTVHLVGNIGVSALNALSDVSASDIVVYELSSFQLWDVQYSPQAAVVLLIEPDHLNVHSGFDEYLDAKANIRRFQKSNDICVYHPTNVFSRQIAQSNKDSKALRYAIESDGGVYVKEGSFYQFEHKICSVNSLRLIGQHNVENACAAITVAKYYDIADDDIQSGLEAFQGLPHRLELIREVDGVKYYNDSFSSAPSATVAAINSFIEPEVLILGGIDKGADFAELIQAIKNKNNIKKVIIMGQIRHKLADLFQELGDKIVLTDLETLQPIVELARSLTSSGDIVLLSPACASFDMFRDFYDRGDQFRAIVEEL